MSSIDLTADGRAPVGLVREDGGLDIEFIKVTLPTHGRPVEVWEIVATEDGATWSEGRYQNGPPGTLETLQREAARLQRRMHRNDSDAMLKVFGY